MDERINVVVTDVEVLKEQVKQLRVASSRIERIENNVNSNTLRVSSYEEIMTIAQQKMNRLEEKLSTVKATSQRNSSESVIVNHDMVATSRRIDHLERDMRDLQHQVNSKITSLQSNLGADNEKLEERIAKIEDQMAKVKWTTGLLIAIAAVGLEVLNVYLGM